MEAFALLSLDTQFEILRNQSVSWILRNVPLISKSLGARFRSDRIWKEKYLEQVEDDIFFMSMSKEIQELAELMTIDPETSFEEERLLDDSKIIYAHGGESLGLTVYFIQSYFIRELVKARKFRFSDGRGPTGLYYYLFAVLWASLNHAWVNKSGQVLHVATFELERYNGNLTNAADLAVNAAALLKPGKFDWLALENTQNGLAFYDSSRTENTIVARSGPFKQKVSHYGGAIEKKDPHLVIGDTSHVGFKVPIDLPFTVAFDAMKSIASESLLLARPGSTRHARLLSILMRYRESLRYLYDEFDVEQKIGTAGIFITARYGDRILHSQNPNGEKTRVWFHVSSYAPAGPGGNYLLGCQLCGASQESVRLHQCSKCDKPPYWCSDACFKIGRATGLGCEH